MGDGNGDGDHVMAMAVFDPDRSWSGERWLGDVTMVWWSVFDGRQRLSGRSIGALVFVKTCERSSLSQDRLPAVRTSVCVASISKIFFPARFYRSCLLDATTARVWIDR